MAMRPGGRRQGRLAFANLQMVIWGAVPGDQRMVALGRRFPEGLYTLVRWFIGGGGVAGVYGRW